MTELNGDYSAYVHFVWNVVSASCVAVCFTLLLVGAVVWFKRTKPLFKKKLRDLMMGA